MIVVFPYRANLEGRIVESVAWPPGLTLAFSLVHDL